MSRDGCVALPRGAMVLSAFVIVVFPDHTRLLFLSNYHLLEIFAYTAVLSSADFFS